MKLNRNHYFIDDNRVNVCLSGIDGEHDHSEQGRSQADPTHREGMYQDQTSHGRIHGPGPGYGETTRNMKLNCQVECNVVT